MGEPSSVHKEEHGLQNVIDVAESSTAESKQPGMENNIEADHPLDPSSRSSHEYYFQEETQVRLACCRLPASFVNDHALFAFRHAIINGSGHQFPMIIHNYVDSRINGVYSHVVLKGLGLPNICRNPYDQYSALNNGTG